ncbi:MAG TPA: hypothetical protein VGL56_06680 [Fimbriimonadaceae bacterium]|jgi:hypothetical protein
MRTNSPFPWFKQRGQTLIIALIVLFVLLLIGFVFIGILNRNIIQANTSQQRSLAADLADAGITYAKSQLINSSQGADWNPVRTQPLIMQTLTGASPALGSTNPVYAIDPDIYWIRPAAISKTSSVYYLHGTDPQQDLGGPDGLGPFTRIQFRNGRALIRVRYAPSDVDVTQTQTFGPVRQPGKTHNFLIIESVGRPGVLNSNDPTSIPRATNLGNVPAADAAFVNPNFALQYQYFNSQADLQNATALLAQYDNLFVQSRKLMAFASIGIIDHALFVTNVSHTSTPADIGIPFDLGINANDDSGATPQPVQPAAIMGSPNHGYPTTAGVYPGGGSIYINGNALIYGVVDATLNAALGETIAVAGTMGGVGPISSTTPGTPTINIIGYSGTSRYDGTATPPTGTTASQFTTFSGPNFNTFGGLIRDGVPGVDMNGNPRGVPYKEPPDITHVDPDTGYSRYLTITRDSGTFGTSGNNGQYGHGKGVYVNNAADLQTQNDENGRLTAGSVQALFQDFLNPNNGQPGSAWQGPYYVPPAAYLQLEPDGFFITLDGSGTMPTWRDQAGNDTGSAKIRYRVGGPISAAAPEGYIIDSYENLGTVSINDAVIPNSIYTTFGQPFSGVLYFEGNLRVRGVTPTLGTAAAPVGCPLTVVSMGNIYIEGSITKGVEQAGAVAVNLLATSPQGGIALLARDYVVLNTTQFFGPADHPVTVKNSTQNPAGLNPIMMAAANGEVDMRAEFLLDPTSNKSGMGTSTNPTNWAFFPSEYTDAVTNAAMDTNMLLTHTMDDGPGSNAFVELLINDGSTTDPNYDYNQTGSSSVAIYMLGQENYQRYAAFESQAFPLYASGVGGGDTNGAYMLSSQVGTPFQFVSPPFPPTQTANDLLIARTAIVPQDIRIEAVIDAQEGSFFVIPGEWFDPKPADARTATSPDNTAPAQLDRLENFGNNPKVPFYQEPLDVKITIDGSITENMPPPISQQSEWLKKWGWIPSLHGSSGEHIPTQHNDAIDGYDVTAGSLYVPNLFIQYDPVLATGRVNGFTVGQLVTNNPPVRTNPQDPTGLQMLPPLPCLPVSPTLFYFGEDNP